MQAFVQPRLSAFALDVAEGLSSPDQKRIPSRYFYDDLGSSLFEAITQVPEYGLTRADERLLGRHAASIAREASPLALVAELGSGSGRKTRRVLEALLRANETLVYSPVDVSCAALKQCEQELADLCPVQSISMDWLEGLAEIARRRRFGGAMLLLFLGSSIGNLEREDIVDFLRHVRAHLRSGDFFLLGADLVKDAQELLAAYDDPTGVTSAFNLNILGRINRELDADFDLRSFAHEVRWNAKSRRIEMHLLSCRNQSVFIRAVNTRFYFRVGETIWTESSHKFTEPELANYAAASGFETVASWVDHEWAFAETLWRAS